MSRLSIAAAVVATMLAALACQPTSNASQPILTDPGEIVMAGVNSTAALHTVHARFDVNVGVVGGQPIGAQSIADVDIDLDTRNFATRSVSAGQGGPDQVSEMINVGGQQFMRTPPDTRWTTFPNMGGVQQPFPSNAEVVAAIASTVESAHAVLQLADAEPCGEATCYHVIAELDAEATWQLLGPLMMGGAANEPPPAGFNMPPITLHVLVDQASRALVAVNTAISLQGMSITLAVSLTNHDVPVQIVAPPPALVDNMNLEGGGGFAVPAPVAAPPVPAESP
jgi:hypothetical protein